MSRDIDAMRNLLLPELSLYFRNNSIFKHLILPILNGEDPLLTMSLINYTVTNYVQEFSSYVEVKDKIIYIYRSYQEQLSRFNKALFDPFCREIKIPFYYEDGKYVVTTVAQLNFYKWAIENKIIDFIRDNYESISNTMKMNTKSSSSSKKSKFTESDKFSSDIEKYKNKVIIKNIINIDV